MINRAQRSRKREHISRKYSAFSRNARMRVPDDSVNQGRFADFSKRSRSSGSHSERADDGGGLVVAGAVGGGSCAMRSPGAFAAALSTESARIKREVCVGFGTG